MANQYFRGEQIGFVGTLKNNVSGSSVVVTDMEVRLLFFRSGASKTLFEVDMEYDSTNQNFSYVWDTKGYKGEFEVRAVAGNDDTGIVVSNDALSITIEPYSPASYTVKSTTSTTASSEVSSQSNDGLEIRDLTLELSVTNSSLELDALDVTTSQSHQLTFAKLLKGGKGDTGATGPQGPTGPAGSLGSVTASVDNTTGTPSVTVTYDGTNADFAFRGLKGQSGESDKAFVGTYGVTTASEVAAAITAGKAVFLRYSPSDAMSHQLMLIDESNSKYVFAESTISTSDGISVFDGHAIALSKYTSEYEAITAGGVIPYLTSQLTNDSGFLTEHQSLSSYRTASAQDSIDTENLRVLAGVDASLAARIQSLEYLVNRLSEQVESLGKRVSELESEQE